MNNETIFDDAIAIMIKTGKRKISLLKAFRPGKNADPARQ